MSTVEHRNLSRRKVLGDSPVGHPELFPTHDFPERNQFPWPRRGRTRPMLPGGRGLKGGTEAPAGAPHHWQACTACSAPPPGFDCTLKHGHDGWVNTSRTFAVAGRACACMLRVCKVKLKCTCSLLAVNDSSAHACSIPRTRARLCMVCMRR